MGKWQVSQSRHLLHRKVSTMKGKTLLLALIAVTAFLGAREAFCAPPQRDGDDERRSAEEYREATQEDGFRADGRLGIVDEGLLTIRGSLFSDHIEVRDEPNLMEGGSIVVRVYRSRARVDVVMKKVYPRHDYVIESIYFDAKSGDDYFWTVNIDVPITALGGPGNDYLEGGSDMDFMVGGTGDNIILGRGDSDYLCGGPNRDFLFGCDGDDFLEGHGGNDFLFGGEGADCMSGGDGADYLDGMNDGCVDILSGNAGNDRFVGYYTRWYFPGVVPFTDTVPEDDFRDFKICDDREIKRITEYFGY